MTWNRGVDQPRLGPAVAELPVTQSDLISAAAHGDAPALEEFCRAWLAPMRRWFARRWRCSTLRSMIDDGVQEVMLECCRPGGALTRFDPARGSAVAAFLRGVAANIAARVERHEARQAVRCRRFAESVDLPPANDDHPRPVGARLAAACAALARPEAGGRDLVQVLRLHFEDRLPVRAIARCLGRPAPEVHVLRRRALRMLRRQLGRTGVA